MAVLYIRSCKCSYRRCRCICGHIIPDKEESLIMPKPVMPKMFYESATRQMHCAAADDVYFTLCGLDVDSGRISEIKYVRIDCTTCLSIIRFCQSLSGRAIKTPRAKIKKCL